MTITNDRPVMVFEREGKYTIGISRKKKDGSYENAYIKIEFNKGVELQNKTLIKINNAWLDFYNWEYQDRKGTTWVIRCNDFEIVNNNLYTELKTKTESDWGENISISESELPF